MSSTGTCIPPMDSPDSTETSFNEIFNPHLTALYDEDDEFFKQLNSFMDTSNGNKDIEVCADPINNSDKEQSFPIDSEDHTESQDLEFQITQPDINKASLFENFEQLNEGLKKKFNAQQNEFQITQPDIIEAFLVEDLKQEKEELKKTFNAQQNELLKYEARLMDKIKEISELEAERNMLKNTLESGKIENIKLQQELELKEAQLKQMKDFANLQCTNEKILYDMKKELETTNKKCEKYERELQHNKQCQMDIEKKIKHLKMTNRKLLNPVLEFGKILKGEGLLTKKMEKELQKFQDNDSENGNEEVE